MYGVALEALKEARNPLTRSWAIQAMYDAFKPQAADWRPIYCNADGSGLNGYQACIQSVR